MTAHTVAALHFVPDARTAIDIRGQDSKLIPLENGIVVDLAMNSVLCCAYGVILGAAGTTSQQPCRGTRPACPQLTPSGAHRRPLHGLRGIRHGA